MGAGSGAFPALTPARIEKGRRPGRDHALPRTGPGQTHTGGGAGDTVGIEARDLGFALLPEGVAGLLRPSSPRTDGRPGDGDSHHRILCATPRPLTNRIRGLSAG